MILIKQKLDFTWSISIYSQVLVVLRWSMYWNIHHRCKALYFPGLILTCDRNSHVLYFISKADFVILLTVLFVCLFSAYFFNLCTTFLTCGVSAGDVIAFNDNANAVKGQTDRRTRNYLQNKSFLWDKVTASHPAICNVTKRLQQKDWTSLSFPVYPSRLLWLCLLGYERRSYWSYVSCLKGIQNKDAFHPSAYPHLNAHILALLSLLLRLFIRIPTSGALLVWRCVFISSFPSSPPCFRPFASFIRRLA